MPMSKPTVVEIPLNATEQVVRIQLEEVTRAVRQARPKRVKVTIQQE